MNVRTGVRLVAVGGLPNLWQVKYYDPTVRVWCDYGDVVVGPEDSHAVQAKLADCRNGRRYPMSERVERVWSV